MIERIRTYEDLLAEKARLQSVLNYNRELIRKDIANVKEEMKPLKTVMGFLSKFTSKDGRNPLINVGVDLIGDVLLKNFLFAKSGFITKFIAPYLIKNFSSNMLTNSGGNIMEKISNTIHQVTNLFKSKPKRVSNNVQ